MDTALDYGYDLNLPADRAKLNEYFDNYKPYNFIYDDWSCWIIAGPVRNLNGYIEVSEDFLDWMKNTDEFNTLTIHGGITFEGGELAIPEMAGLNVIGFDTAHFMDLLLLDIKPEIIDMYKKAGIQRIQNWDVLNEKKLWLESDVEAELKKLAKQLSEIHKKAYPHGTTLKRK